MTCRFLRTQSERIMFSGNRCPGCIFFRLTNVRTMMGCVAGRILSGKSDDLNLWS